ncbi:hypothetical protein ACFL59_00020 [Planctomycetota bacterium]
MSFMGKIDGNTQYVGPEETKIDHGASAKENLQQAKRDIVEAFTADKMKKCMEFKDTQGNAVTAVLTGMFGVLMLPWAAMGDLIEVPTKPFHAVKNLADAALHGIVAGFQKITD